MSTRWVHAREWCLFSDFLFFVECQIEEIALKNQCFLVGIKKSCDDYVMFES